MKHIIPISWSLATRLVQEMHYSNSMPKLNKHYLGCYDDDILVGVITLWWGTRPLHTIQKLFPWLTAKDYYEIGRMCFLDSYWKNTESEYLSLMHKWVKINLPEVKIIYTWADWMLGRPWYVYQAANYLYWWYIRTDTYYWPDWEKIHPRATNKIGGRPNYEKIQDMKRTHYQWKQFRYCYILTSKKEKKKLLESSTVKRGIQYPKHEDLLWKIQSSNWYIDCSRPIFDTSHNSFSLSKKWTVASLF